MAGARAGRSSETTHRTFDVALWGASGTGPMVDEQPGSERGNFERGSARRDHTDAGGSTNPVEATSSAETTTAGLSGGSPHTDTNGGHGDAPTTSHSRSTTTTAHIDPAHLDSAHGDTTKPDQTIQTDSRPHNDVTSRGVILLGPNPRNHVNAFTDHGDDSGVDGDENGLLVHGSRTDAPHADTPHGDSNP